MCGRYLFDQDFDALYRKYMLYESELNELPQKEIRPTDAAPVIVNQNGRNQLVLMNWGLNGYQKNQRLINARSETLLEKSRFSRLMDRYRCIVPASAFYEWEKQGTRKIKHTFGGSGILSFAALYEPGEDGHTFTIITMAALGDVAKIHDRMPVALPDEMLSQWIHADVRAGEAYQKLLEQRPQYFLNDPVTQLTFL